MSKEFLVGWPALVRAGLGSEWERSRSRSDTIIDPSRRSLTTQTFPDTEPAPEPVSKVGARDSPPSHYAVTQWARVKTTPCQWSPVGLAIRWTVRRVRHWVWSVVSTGGGETSVTRGPWLVQDHCSVLTTAAADHWAWLPAGPTGRSYSGAARGQQNKKNTHWDYLDTDVLLSESKYSFGCFPPPFYVDFVPFENLFACCLNILIWKRRNLATKSWNLYLSGTLCLSWSDLEDRWALVLGHVMQLLWGLAGGALHVMQCTIMLPLASTMTVSSVHVHRNTVSESVSSWYSPFQKKLVTSWPVTQPRDLRQCLTSARMVSYESAKVTLQSGIGLPSKAD